MATHFWVLSYLLGVISLNKIFLLLTSIVSWNSFFDFEELKLSIPDTQQVGSYIYFPCITSIMLVQKQHNCNGPHIQWVTESRSINYYNSSSHQG